ncbi:chemotaxis protein CheB [Leptolyngbya sp. BC1307]|uniref:chemotaxis protein CheB n=1 Tax=Leptolyngbya sp. BC1307 TaxID=2029589 RepID=UPI000EFA974F|nr:chemotaxis protein CheB [Leptolyngbya sp. BC1307]
MMSPSEDNSSGALVASDSQAVAIKTMDSEQSFKTDAPFPVVGIAASAGGLEAFTELICHLPTDTGMAFVLIQHLSPDHESLLSEILGRATTMPVQQVTDRMTVEPNEIYVIPPGTQMTLEDGLLHLVPRQKTNGKHHPGDAFFESLALDRGTKAIAVVLSGTDGDGSHGLKAVKVAGGVTFAQCESTAKFDSMPNTAVATGNVDFVLPPEQIAAELTKLSRSPLLFAADLIQAVKEVPPPPGDALAKIFALLRTTTGVDFTRYKPNTLNRRMQRRMVLYQLESLEEYAEYLQAHPEEVQALYEEILIHVTSFFRDPQVFEQLKVQIFPKISENKSLDAPLRIWVAGCSTGQEVYSIAVCLLEFFDDQATVPPIQIFATDISETAISKARSGFYLDSEMKGVSPERQRRFFVSLPSGGYQISSAIRGLCVFARHNLVGDPPFSNLDLISCRNVLIYLSDPLQKRLMSLFHYSLNLTGLLLLGTSETVKNASDLFATVDESCKLYARKLTSTRPLFSFTTTQPASSANSPQRISESFVSPVDLAQEVSQLISNRYAPLSVVVDDQMQILQMRGDLNPYMELIPGTTELNLLLMARESLAIVLRTALYQAQTENAVVRQEQIQLEAGEQPHWLNLEVMPFRPTTTDALYFLVVLETVSPTAPALSPASISSQEPADLERENMQLRESLAAATQRELSAQAHLQAVIQEQNQLNQSLRVANEEILSSNEELQSTNEELQTAKEEIQATNEELSTTNDELRSRNLQQNRDNSDLNNFVASISVPIVMLTNDLRIRRFTPTAQRLFNFIPTDVGRPFSDLHANFDVSQLEPMILEVLETLNTQEQELQTQEGHWYSLRIRPYRTTENQIDGVTLVFMDIDALKRHSATLEAARNYAEAIVETVQIPLVALDADLQVNTANRAFYKTFQVSASATEQVSLFELGNGQWNVPALRLALEEMLINHRPIQDLDVEHNFEQIGQKTLLLNACRLQREDNADMILLAIEDITERKQNEAELKAADRRKDDFLAALGHELRNPLNAISNSITLMQTLEEADFTETASRDESHEQLHQRAGQLHAVASRQLTQLTRLVDDLLDVSRVAYQKIQLHRQQMDLTQLLRDLVTDAESAVSEKRLTLNAVLPEAVIWVNGDTARLMQAFTNVLQNAIKFSDLDGHIEISTQVESEHITTRTTDTGIGMEVEALTRIFTAFSQEDRSLARSGGLGLGLPLAKGIIEFHEGQIWAESAGIGQGTAVMIRLPQLIGATEVLPPPSDAVCASSVAASGSQHILIVEDNEDSAFLLQLFLEDLGYQIDIANNGEQGLSLARQLQPDVIISDIGLTAAMDGYALARAIRSDPALDAVYLIANSGYGQPEDKVKASAAGFDEHFTKPVNLDQLKNLIEQYRSLNQSNT